MTGAGVDDDEVRLAASETEAVPGGEERGPTEEVRPIAWGGLSRWDLLPIVPFGAVAAFSLFLLLLYGYGVDQGIYATVADEMLHGGAPYKDAWDFKPPGIYFFFVLARIFGRGEHGIRVLEVAAWLSLILAYALFCRRHLGQLGAGLVAGCLAAVVVSQLEFWHTAQPESFATVALAWAILLASVGANGERGSGRRELAAWAGAGACYAVAGLLKFPLGGGILVSFVLLCRRSYRRARGDGATRLGALRATIRPTLALGGGALAPVAAVLLYFAAKGALGALVETLFVFTPEYTRIGGWSMTGVVKALWPTTREVLGGGYSPLLLFGLLLLALPRRRLPLAEPVGHALGAFLFAFLAIPLQAKFFSYHHAPALALCGLFAGIGYYRAFAELRGRPLWALLLLALVALLYKHYPATRFTPIPYFTRAEQRLRIFGKGRAERRRILDPLGTAGHINGPANRVAAEWLFRHTPPGSRIYIWGFEPAIYVAARRRPASRYIYNVPQRAAWSMAVYQLRTLVDLARHPPAAILVELKDRFSWVVGNDKDSLQALSDFPKLRELIEQEYVEDRRSDKFIFYRRRSMAELDGAGGGRGPRPREAGVPRPLDAGAAP